MCLHHSDPLVGGTFEPPSSPGRLDHTVIEANEILGAQK